MQYVWQAFTTIFKFSVLLLAVETYFADYRVSSQIAVFVYTFCRLLNLGQKMNMFF